MSRLAIVIIITIVVCSMFVTMARTLGSSYQSPSAAILKAEICSPQPCWHGIRLNNSAQELIEILQHSSVKLDAPLPPIAPWVASDTPCWLPHGRLIWLMCLQAGSKDPTKLESAVLYPLGNKFTLGDAVAIFGEPSTFYLVGTTNRLWITVHFQDDIVAYGYVVPFYPSPGYDPDRFRISLDIPISGILYYSAKVIKADVKHELWKGFRRFKSPTTIYN